jgi:hypothetical protein
MGREVLRLLRRRLVARAVCKARPLAPFQRWWLRLWLRVLALAKREKGEK